MRRMKLTGTLIIAVVLPGAGAVQADIVAGYDAGIPPVFGTPGADDPANQGWVSSVTGSNAWADAFDSGDGGWRTVDGTSTTNAFYQYDLSPQSAAAMAPGWTATVTLSMDSDAVNSAGGFVDDYYLPPNNDRQNDIAIWIENASIGYLYVLYLKIDADSNLLVDDGTAMHQLTSDGSAYDNFKTLTITHDGSDAVLSYGGLDFALATAGSGGSDRIVFGAVSTPGQGSAIWNSFVVDAIPAPGGVAVLAVAGFLALRRRR